jgi:hypothetical protein
MHINPPTHRTHRTHRTLITTHRVHRTVTSHGHEHAVNRHSKLPRHVALCQVWMNTLFCVRFLACWRSVTVMVRVTLYSISHVEQQWEKWKTTMVVSHTFRAQYNKVIKWVWIWVWFWRRNMNVWLYLHRDIRVVVVIVMVVVVVVKFLWNGGTCWLLFPWWNILRSFTDNNRRYCVPSKVWRRCVFLRIQGTATLQREKILRPFQW